MATVAAVCSCPALASPAIARLSSHLKFVLGSGIKGEYCSNMSLTSSPRGRLVDRMKTHLETGQIPSKLSLTIGSLEVSGTLLYMVQKLCLSMITPITA